MYRVIWQYSEKRMGALDASIVPAQPIDIADSTLFGDITQVGRPEPVFPRPPLALRAGLLAMPSEFSADPTNDLTSYYHTFVEGLSAAQTLRERLLNESDIVYADIQPRPQPPFIMDDSRRKRLRLPPQGAFEALSLHPTSTPSLEHLQKYLDPAPGGIDAKSSWPAPGGRGQGITIVDIEDGWDFGHEDLREGQIGVIYGPNSAGTDHGTAVLGIISGDLNQFGVVGICSEAIVAAAAAHYDVQNGKWNAAAPIHFAAERLHPGDVILLEMHAPGPNATGSGQEGFIPIEYWKPEFASIRYAVARGIHVVEAGGNGGENLDDEAYDHRFSRDHRDSGAILVGGGASSLQPDARSRIWWSNYGSRLDVQGWGEDIVTAGGRSAANYHDLQDHEDPQRCYTQSFGGTSGASPIVVGAVACISGLLRAQGQDQLSPSEMCELLVRTGTPQASQPDAPTMQHIGPLPNLKKALEELGILSE